MARFNRGGVVVKLSFLFANTKHTLKKPGAWLIRKFDKSAASHVAISIQVGNVTYVFESVAPNSRVLEISEWLTHYDVAYSFDFVVPEAKRWEALNFLEKIVDRPYSFSQIVLIALTNLFLPLQFLLRGAILNHERALICTEVISRFVEKFMRYDLRRTHDQHGISDIDVMAVNLALQDYPWKD